MANKLDAVIHVLLLEVGCSETPLNDLASYSEQVVNNCSDQGLGRHVSRFMSPSIVHATSF